MHRQNQRMRWLPAATGLMLGFGTVALASLHSSRSFAAEDAYTRAIREEGARLDVLKRPVAEETPVAEAKETKAPAGVPVEFETTLRAAAPASFRFYSDLTEVSRQKVYALYLKEGGVTEEVKRLIVRLRLGK